MARRVENLLRCRAACRAGGLRFDAASTSDRDSSQCAAPDSWRPARRLWHTRGKWLHEWSWRVRNIAWFRPVDRRDADIHGGGLRDGVRYQTPMGRLACET